MQFGTQLKQLRQKLGMTQGQLCKAIKDKFKDEKIKLSVPYYTMIERGDELPVAETCKKLDLFFETGDKLLRMCREEKVKRYAEKIEEVYK